MFFCSLPFNNIHVSSLNLSLLEKSSKSFSTMNFFLAFSSAAEKQNSEEMALRTAEKLLKVFHSFDNLIFFRLTIFLCICSLVDRVCSTRFFNLHKIR